jgi:hypothetical protein
MSTWVLSLFFGGIIRVTHLFSFLCCVFLLLLFGCFRSMSCANGAYVPGLSILCCITVSTTYINSYACSKIGPWFPSDYVLVLTSARMTSVFTIIRKFKKFSYLSYATLMKPFRYKKDFYWIKHVKHIFDNIVCYYFWTH